MNHIQLLHRLTFTKEEFVTVVHGSFHSYKTASTCIEPRSAECRHSFAVEVTTASGNWKYPLPLKIIYSAVSNGYYVLEMADT